jgi:hypothetical protein
MNIIEALKLAYEGRKVRRKTWYFADNNRCVHIFVAYKPTAESDMSQIPLKTFFPNNENESKYSNFLPADILADDWEVVNE